MGLLDVIAELTRARGQALAEGQRAQGAIWGNAINNIGQQVASIPSQLQQAKQLDELTKLRAQQLQLGQQQLASGQLALEQQQRAAKSQQVFESVLKDPQNYDADGHPNDAAITQALKSQDIGAWQHWNDITQKMADHSLAMRKTLGEIATSDAALGDRQRKFQDAQRDYLGQLAFNAEGLLNQQPTDPLHARDTTLASVGRAAADGAITEQQAKDFMLQTAQASPDQLRQVFGSFVPPAMRSKLEEQAAKTAKEQAEARKAGAEATAIETTGRTTPPNLQQAEFQLDGKGLPRKGTFNPATGQYFLNGEDVTARVLKAPPASVLYPQATGAQGLSNIEIKPGTREYRLAQDLAYGNLTMADMQRMYGRAVSNANLKAAIYDTARQLNPDFNPAQFELGYKIASNAQMRNRLIAIDALGPVIDKVDALVDQTGNGGFPKFNQLLQSAKFNVGNTPVTNFRQMQILLGDEVGNALGVGTGSDLKTRLGLDLVNPNLSPANFKSTMEQLRDVLQARKSSILQQFGPYGKTLETPGAQDEYVRDPKTGKLVKKGG